MRILKIFAKNKEKKRLKLVDFSRDSLENIGRDQIKKMVEKGISLPVVML